MITILQAMLMRKCTFYLSFLKKVLFIYLTQRKSERAQAGVGGGGDQQRQKKQAPHRAGLPHVGLDPRTLES